MPLCDAIRCKLHISSLSTVAWEVHNLVDAKIPTNANIELCRNESKYTQTNLNKEGPFDVIIVGGAVRYPCVETSIQKIFNEEIIVLDNSEWYPNACALLREHGFMQVYFSGFSPINSLTSCASLFVKNTEASRHRQTVHEWAPIGGRFLKAHDDMPFTAINEETLLLDD